MQYDRRARPVHLLAEHLRELLDHVGQEHKVEEVGCQRLKHIPVPELAAGEVGYETLSPKALATGALMLGLRTTARIDLDGFTARYGVDLLAANDALVARLAAEGRPVLHAGPEGGRWLAPTASGLAVADGMAAAFDITLPS